MFSNRTGKAALAMLALCVPPTAVLAQQSVTSSSLTGRVLDPMNAAVPHVVVTATELATGLETTATTDREGRFRMPYLPAGAYSLTVQPAGFALTTQNVRLTIGAAF